MFLNEKLVWKTVHELFKEPRVVSQQWKLFNNVYPTNIFLKKIGRTQSENCHFFNVCDFINHLFFSCLAVKMHV